MGRRRLPWTEAYIASLVREGRGQGEGYEYLPWITTQSFASRGTQSRIPIPGIGSAVHVMSNIERHMFLLHRHRGGLVAYLSQFPLPREVTLAVAEHLGIRHPRYPSTTVPVVMTIDALVTTRTPDNLDITCAWDAKPHSELNNKRTLEKLSIVRGACDLLGYPHHLFTDKTVPRTTIRSIEWLSVARNRANECPVESEMLRAHKLTLVADLYNKRPRKTIDQYCTRSDKVNNLPLGLSLRALKQLILEDVLNVDISMAPADIMESRVPIPSSPLLPQAPGGRLA
jgi:hypothetical protein